MIKGKYREVSVVIVLDDDKFLILKRSENVSSGQGFWNFPGGSVEEGESLEEAGARELKEEANIDIKSKDLDYVKDIINGGLRIHIFITNKFSGKVKINKESSNFKWITIDDIEDYLFIGGGTIDEFIVETIKEYI
jgi:8-oxo-dGTP diphosphatase